jgi:hypothetical protein
MKRYLPWLFALVIPSASNAQISPDSPLVQALRDGHASAPLPDSAGAQTVAQKIKGKTGSPGDVTVEYYRTARFVSQPRCGRVAFGLYQRSSNTVWRQFGGQMNICEDGTPPQRECKGTKILVSADIQCPDGSTPVDTTEVKAAIGKALAGGSMTAKQAAALFDAQVKKTMGRK